MSKTVSMPSSSGHLTENQPLLPALEVDADQADDEAKATSRSRPRSGDDPTSALTERNSDDHQREVSPAPRVSLRRRPSTARKARSRVAIVPATNDPMAAVATLPPRRGLDAPSCWRRSP